MDEAVARRIAELEAMVAQQAATIAAKDAQIAQLEARVRELLEQLNRTSSNSNKPPSSDPPSARATRRTKLKEKSGRKRGGQPGHQGSQRALVPPEEVDEVIDHFPGERENCFTPAQSAEQVGPRRRARPRHPTLERPARSPRRQRPTTVGWLMVTLTISIDDDTMTRLKKEARERGTTVDELVALGARLVADSTGEIELTEEDEAALEAADAEVARGEFVTKEQLFKKLKAMRG